MMLLTKLSQMNDGEIIFNVIAIGIVVWYLVALLSNTIKAKNNTNKILEILENKKENKEE